MSPSRRAGFHVVASPDFRLKKTDGTIKKASASTPTSTGIRPVKKTRGAAIEAMVREIESLGDIVVVVMTGKIETRTIVADSQIRCHHRRVGVRFSAKTGCERTPAHHQDGNEFSRKISPASILS